MQFISRPGAAGAARRGRFRRGGFTLMELVLGMMVTTLIMAAVGALMGSVARGWEQSTSAGNSSNTVFQLHLRLQRLFRSARQIGAYRVGSIEGDADPQAAILFWKGDTNGDGVMQYSEVALLEYRTGATLADDELVLYQIQYPAGLPAATIAAYDQPADSEKTDWIYDKPGMSAIDLFKKQPYLNPEPVVIARYISGCEFHPIDNATMTRPMVNYLINVQKDGQPTETEYGTVTVRDAAALPLSQRGN